MLTFTTLFDYSAYLGDCEEGVCNYASFCRSFIWEIYIYNNTIEKFNKKI